MLMVLHSFYRPICLVLLALLGLACGHLIDTVLQINLRPQVAAATTPAKPKAQQPARTPETSLDMILQNNIFDANNRSASAAMALGRTGEDNAGPAAAASRVEATLLGTVVAGQDSRALLQINQEAELYLLGGKVPGLGTLEEISRSQVIIRGQDQRRITLTLYEQGSASAEGNARSQAGTGEKRHSPSASTAPRAMAGGSQSRPGEGEAGENGGGDIRAVGENRWLISRSTVESVRDNFSEQLRLAQMQPRLVNGKTDGFLIQRINSKSLLAKMGLQRGDVVMDVNNIKLDSPEKALMIFQQLREARQINLSIERNGAPISLAYEIE